QRGWQTWSLGASVFAWWRRRKPGPDVQDRAWGFWQVLLRQLANRLAIIEDVHRPAAAVGEGLGRGDADGVIDRGKHVGGCATAVAWVLAAGARSANGLAHTQSAAGDHRRHDRRPVIASGLIVDARSTAELAPHHRHDVAVHAAVAQVADEVGDT